MKELDHQELRVLVLEGGFMCINLSVTFLCMIICAFTNTLDILRGPCNGCGVCWFSLILFSSYFSKTQLFFPFFPFFFLKLDICPLCNIIYYFNKSASVILWNFILLTALIPLQMNKCRFPFCFLQFLNILKNLLPCKKSHICISRSKCDGTI